MRALCRDDLPSIVEMLRLLRVESPEYRHVKDDPEYVLKNARTLFDADLMFGCIERRGAMVGVLSNTWFCEDLEATEQLLYVHPEFRGSSAAVRLIYAFEEAAHRRGAGRLHVGVTTDIRSAQTVSMYVKLGYEPKGTSLVKRLT